MSFGRLCVHEMFSLNVLFIRVGAGHQDRWRTSTWIPTSGFTTSKPTTYMTTTTTTTTGYRKRPLTYKHTRHISETQPDTWTSVPAEASSAGLAARLVRSGAPAPASPEAAAETAKGGLSAAATWPTSMCPRCRSEHLQCLSGMTTPVW